MLSEREDAERRAGPDPPRAALAHAGLGGQERVRKARSVGMHSCSSQRASIRPLPSPRLPPLRAHARATHTKQKQKTAQARASSSTARSSASASCSCTRSSARTCCPRPASSPAARSPESRARAARAPPGRRLRGAPATLRPSEPLALPPPYAPGLDRCVRAARQPAVPGSDGDDGADDESRRGTARQRGRRGRERGRGGGRRGARVDRVGVSDATQLRHCCQASTRRFSRQTNDTAALRRPPDV